MLRRKPTRVEDRPDVAEEYEQYIREKERLKKKDTEKNHSQSFQSSSDDPLAMQYQQQKLRQQTRARLGIGQ
jgi:hypothetical protein